MKKLYMRGAAWLLALLMVLSPVFVGCDALDGILDNVVGQEQNDANNENNGTQSGEIVQKPTGEQTDAEKALGVPKYSGKPYVALDGNIPDFSEDEITDEAYETYSDLDSLGRCGETEACIGIELMPTEERESISSVKPSGWVNKKYDTELVDGGYIYNRCHLIGFQLTGENANKQNLITGTRYMNVDGMLPFENMVADYVKETENHVMYRVTPVYDGNDLVACGVIIEAYSVEDEGEGISFKVYVYNVQPGIVIDYATGESWLADEYPDTEDPAENEEKTEMTQKPTDTGSASTKNSYVLNTSTKKVHDPTCRYAESIKESNRQEYQGDLFDLLSDGYTACGTCDPT